MWKPLGFPFRNTERGLTLQGGILCGDVVLHLYIPGDKREKHIEYMVTVTQARVKNAYVFVVEFYAVMYVPKARRPESLATQGQSFRYLYLI